MRCKFCTRQALHSFPDGTGICEECSKAYREGFEHGRVYESIDRRRRGKR